MKVQPIAAPSLEGAPEAVCADGNGNFYIADTNNYRVRKVDSTGTITTYAGSGSSYPISGNGGPATSANIGSPFGLLLAGENFTSVRTSTSGPST